MEIFIHIWAKIFPQVPSVLVNSFRQVFCRILVVLFLNPSSDSFRWHGDKWAQACITPSACLRELWHHLSASCLVTGGIQDLFFLFLLEITTISHQENWGRDIFSMIHYERMWTRMLTRTKCFLRVFTVPQSSTDISVFWFFCLFQNRSSMGSCKGKLILYYY